MEGKDDGFAIGIDLGTTYSCVGAWKYDRIEIIPNDQGNRITPSCVAFTDETRLIGDAVMNQASINSINTIFGELEKSLASSLRFHDLSSVVSSCYFLVEEKTVLINFLTVCVTLGAGTLSSLTIRSTSASTRWKERMNVLQSELIWELLIPVLLFGKMIA
ncbi:hypothetical protein MRB53_011096 [Persea americana]|uniref:Uncharacterized protein n=1 Tax=Persea americana TaxID=3435 RepID=A0ACC2LU09_PERAE|nr:hypothetical protein MRB53_011096 [Persea americana]